MQHHQRPVLVMYLLSIILLIMLEVLFLSDNFMLHVEQNPLDIIHSHLRALMCRYVVVVVDILALQETIPCFSLLHVDSLFIEIG